MGVPDSASGKEPACQCRRGKIGRFNLWVWKMPWRRAWQPTSVFLPGESYGQRSLLGDSLWGHKELDMTEWLQGRGGTRILTQICLIPKALLVSYTLKTLIFVMSFPYLLLLNLIHACLLNHFSLVRLFETLWNVAHKAPLSLGLPRWEYWSGFPFPSPGNLPTEGSSSCLLLVYGFFTNEPPKQPLSQLGIN